MATGLPSRHQPKAFARSDHAQTRRCGHDPIQPHRIMTQRGGSDVLFAEFVERPFGPRPRRSHLARWCGRGDAAEAAVVRPDLRQHRSWSQFAGRVELSRNPSLRPCPIVMGFAALSLSYQPYCFMCRLAQPDERGERWTDDCRHRVSPGGPGRSALPARIFGRFRLRRINTGSRAGIKIFNVGIPANYNRSKIRLRVRCRA